MHSSAAVATLTRGLVDYAGLFPPAALSMADAVAEYAKWLGSASTDSLGRFVVPVARLDEFIAARRALPDGRAASRRWRLAVLAGNDVQSDASAIERFNREQVGVAFIDVVEARCSSPESIEQLAHAMPRYVAAFAELPITGDPRELIDVVKRERIGAKVRTGGITTDAFPPAGSVARFIRRCVEAGVPFKATAGLHHPLAGDYRLTYEQHPPRGRMYGYLNVLLATAAAMQHASDDAIVAALTETNRNTLVATRDALSLGTTTVDQTTAVALRARAMISFGSCSFSEPVTELEALSLGTA